MKVKSLNRNQIRYNDISDLIQLIYGKRVCIFRGGSSFDMIRNQQKHIFDDIACSEFRIKHSDFATVKIAEAHIVAHNVDIVIAIGGGTVIDVAKIAVDSSSVRDKVKLICVPTTAGTGSEHTAFAVCYDSLGTKYSIPTSVPAIVIHDPNLLEFLPKEQRIYGMFDTLAQLIESSWTKNSNNRNDIVVERSVAIDMILQNYVEWIERPNAYCANLFQQLSASSGHMINQSKTSIAHAFSYAFTTHHDMPHGLAVMMTLPFFNRIAKRKNMHYINESKLRVMIAKYVDFVPLMTYTTFMTDIYHNVNAERLSTSLITLNDFDSHELYNYIRNQFNRRTKLS